MFPGSSFLCPVFYAFLFTSRYICRDETRSRTAHGGQCDLLIVLGLEKPTFAIVPFEAQLLEASARSRGAACVV